MEPKTLETWIGDEVKVERHEFYDTDCYIPTPVKRLEAVDHLGIVVSQEGQEEFWPHASYEKILRVKKVARLDLRDLQLARQAKGVHELLQTWRTRKGALMQMRARIVRPDGEWDFEIDPPESSNAFSKLDYQPAREEE